MHQFWHTEVLVMKYLRQAPRLWRLWRAPYATCAGRPSRAIDKGLADSAAILLAPFSASLGFEKMTIMTTMMTVALSHPPLLLHCFLSSCRAAISYEKLFSWRSHRKGSHLKMWRLEGTAKEVSAWSFCLTRLAVLWPDARSPFIKRTAGLIDNRMSNVTFNRHMICNKTLAGPGKVLTTSSSCF